MKLSKFENLEIKKNGLSNIKGGTSTTVYSTVGYAENEYEDTNGNGELDEDEVHDVKVVEFPNP